MSLLVVAVVRALARGTLTVVYTTGAVVFLFGPEVLMSRRSSMGRRHSKKVFTKAAQRVHPANSYRPMRGGIRL